MTQCPFHPLDLVSALEGKLRLTAERARLFDRFLYDGTYDGRPVLVHEFAPQGLVRRTKGGSIVPADARFDAAYAQARDDYQSAMRSAHPHLLVVIAEKGNWVVTEPAGKRLVDETGDRSFLLASALKSVVDSGLVLGTICPDMVFHQNGKVVFAGCAPDYRDLIDVAGQSDLAGPTGYAAPEVFDAKKRAPIGHEADVFAASALMLRMVSGRDPADIRTQDLSTDLGQAPAPVRTGLTLSRKARAEALASWFDSFKPPVSVTPPTPAPAPVQPAPPQPQPARTRRIPIIVIVAATVVAIPLSIMALTVGLDSWKQASMERRTREAREAVERCRTAIGQSARDAQALCSKALDKIPDTQSPDHSWVAYNLGVLCEKKDACGSGKTALDYYRMAADDRTSNPGKVANYKIAKLDKRLSLAERHDHYAPAAGVLKKPDTNFIKANRTVYADANYQIGQIFDTWSRQESFDNEEVQRLSPGASSSPQKIAMISAINRFEVAKKYGVNTNDRLLDLYVRRGDSDAGAGQYEAAASAYKRAGTLGSADAKFKAAELYFAGHVPSMTQDEAVALVNAASEDGNRDAELCLAAMRYFGYPYETDTIGGLAAFASLTMRGVNSARLDELACRDWIRRGRE